MTNQPMSDPRDRPGRDLAALILAAICDAEPTESAHAWVADWGSLDSQPIDGNVNLLAVADAIIAAGYVKPKPPTVYPDHDIDVERMPYCTVCGRDVQWDDNTESWQH